MTPELIKRRDELSHFHMHRADGRTLSEESFRQGWDACCLELYKPINPSEIRILGMTMQELMKMREYYLKNQW